MRKGLIRAELTLQEHLSQEVARTPIGSVTSFLRLKLHARGELAFWLTPKETLSNPIRVLDTICTYSF